MKKRTTVTGMERHRCQPMVHRQASMEHHNLRMEPPPPVIAATAEFLPGKATDEDIKDFPLTIYLIRFGVQ